MSYLHIFKDEKEETWHLQDGYSDSLHRHVDLDDQAIICFLGKQLGGRTIDASGQLGRQIIALSRKLWKNRDRMEGLLIRRVSGEGSLFPSGPKVVDM